MRSGRLLEATEREYQRRRIINAITQGAAIREPYAFLLQPDGLNLLDDGLVDLYTQVLKKTFSQFDDPAQVRAILSALGYVGAESKGKMESILSSEVLAKLDDESRQELLSVFPGGRFNMMDVMRILTQLTTIESRYKDILEQEAVEIFKNQFPIVDELEIEVKAEIGKSRMGGLATAEVIAGWDAENERYYIDAVGSNFAFLLHELIKGLYEIIGLSGWGPSAEDNEEVSQALDVTKEEPLDQKYGKYLYDNIKKLVIGTVNSLGMRFEEAPQILEKFLKKVYEEAESSENQDWFVTYIGQIMEDKLSRENFEWTKDMLIDLKNEINKRNLGDLFGGDEGDEEEV
jgi:hypothetical protein